MTKLKCNVGLLTLLTLSPRSSSLFYELRILLSEVTGNTFLRKFLFTGNMEDPEIVFVRSVLWYAESIYTTYSLVHIEHTLHSGQQCCLHCAY